MGKTSKLSVLIVGKSGSILHWLEDARYGFEDACTLSRTFALNGNTPLAAMCIRLAKMRGPARERLLVHELVATRSAYKPQIILFVQAFGP